jgi:hypothetical protein
MSALVIRRAALALAFAVLLPAAPGRGGLLRADQPRSVAASYTAYRFAAAEGWAVRAAAKR